MSQGQGSIVFSHPIGPGTGGTFAGANSGTSVSGAGFITLGQSVGQAGNPAALTRATEVPLAGFNLSFDGAGRIMIGTSAPDATPADLQIAGSISIPISNLSGSQGAIFVGGHPFFNTFEPVPAVAGQATSLFMGFEAGNQTATNVDAQINIGIGFESLTSITSAQNNCAVGVQAGQNLTTGINNALFGHYSGQAINTGAKNTAVGIQALNLNTTGQFNTAIGQQSGLNCIVGNQNTFLGASAGWDETGSQKIYIGDNSGHAAQFSFFYADIGNGFCRMNGQMGVAMPTPFLTAPTANVMIGPPITSHGPPTPGTGPLKFVGGPLMTAPEAGLMEYDGTSFWLTNSTPTRAKIGTLSPLILPAATLLATPVNGALEYDGANFYFTQGSTRLTVWMGVAGSGSGVTPPPSHSAVALTTFLGPAGGGGTYLAGPDNWLTVVYLGVTYKVPMFTP